MSTAFLFLSISKPPKSPCHILSAYTTTRTHSSFLLWCLPLRKNPNTITPPNDPTSSTDLRVAFACGGPGGHIYSAIGIADELRSISPSSQLLFLGAANSLESTVVPAAGYDFSPIHTLHLNPCFPFALLRSLSASASALRRFRPHLVVGTGGLVSLPVCLAAALLQIKLIIQEQNASPGLANRALAPFAQKIFLAFNGCVRHFPKKKCMVYGNPVRMSLRKPVPKAVGRAHFFPRAAREMEEAEVVLVLGGSEGGPEINVAVLNMYYEMLMERKNRYIIWQTGEEGFCEMESLVKRNRRLLLTP